MTKRQRFSTRIPAILASILFAMVVGWIMFLLMPVVHIAGAVTAMVVVLSILLVKWRRGSIKWKGRIVCVILIILVPSSVIIGLIVTTGQRNLRLALQFYDIFERSFGSVELSQFARFAKTTVENQLKESPPVRYRTLPLQTKPVGKILFIWTDIRGEFDRQRWGLHLIDATLAEQKRTDLGISLAKRVSEVEIIALVERSEEIQPLNAYLPKEGKGHFCYYNVWVVNALTATILGTVTFHEGQLSPEKPHGFDEPCREPSMRYWIYQWLRDPNTLHTLDAVFDYNEDLYFPLLPLVGEKTCTKADEKGCTMAKGANSKEMVVVGAGMKVGDKMDCMHMGKDGKMECMKEMMKK